MVALLVAARMDDVYGSFLEDAVVFNAVDTEMRRLELVTGIDLEEDGVSAASLDSL